MPLENLPPDALPLVQERAPPTRLLYLWEAFGELHMERRFDGNTGRPFAIGSDQIYWWQKVNRTTLHRWEVKLLRRVDWEWRKIMDPSVAVPEAKLEEEE